MSILKFSPLPRLKKELQKLIESKPEYAAFQKKIDAALEAAGDDPDARAAALSAMLKDSGKRLDQALAELKAETAKLVKALDTVNSIKKDIQ